MEKQAYVWVSLGEDRAVAIRYAADQSLSGLQWPGELIYEFSLHVATNGRWLPATEILTGPLSTEPLYHGPRRIGRVEARMDSKRALVEFRIDNLEGKAFGRMTSYELETSLDRLLRLTDAEVFEKNDERAPQTSK